MSHLLNIFNRLPVSFVKGEGVYLWDAAGNRYLDFLAGVAVCQLGHAHPRLVSALTEQARKLWHVSNVFQVPEQEMLAKDLIAHSGMSAAFFSNSGAEANEALIKLSRLWGKAYRGGAHEVIVLSHSFHGRTMATLSATGQEKIQTGFAPLVPTFKVVPAGDIAALAQAISSATAGVLIEVIQAEGGIHPLSAEYLMQLRALCDRHSLLLMVDEVQTGMGRTGCWFGFQGAVENEAFRPDAIALAKGIAGGLPMGAYAMTERAAALFAPGSHGSTFAGSPLVCRVAMEVMQIIEDEELLEHATLMGDYLQAGLRELARKHDSIRDVRGRGLLVGCELAPRIEAAAVVRKGLDQGVIFNAVTGNTLRFVPALIIEETHIAQGLEVLDVILSEL